FPPPFRRLNLCVLLLRLPAANVDPQQNRDFAPLSPLCRCANLLPAGSRRDDRILTYMSIHQTRSREFGDQDKSRRSVSCPLNRALFCARTVARPDRRDRWKEKFRSDRGPTLLQ